MANTSTTGRVGNPLLYSLPSGRITLQPYWVIICQYVFLQICQRLWNRIRYKTWLLHLELIILFGLAYGSTKTSLSYNFEIDVFDALQSLSVMAHFIWYCILQTSCMSAPNADDWKCFNIFGYMLMNYVTPSAINLIITVGTKLSWCMKVLESREYTSSNKVRLGLWIFWCFVPTIAFLFVMSVYYFVNLAPMFICYLWVILIWLIGAGLIGVIFGLLLLTCPINRELIDIFPFGRFVRAMFISFESTLAAYLLVLLYNYTQYWYFGDTYINAMVSEYQSRDTNTYFQVLKNSTEQIGHTILATF